MPSTTDKSPPDIKWQTEHVAKIGPVTLRILKLAKEKNWSVTCDEAGVSAAPLGTSDIDEARADACRLIASELIHLAERFQKLAAQLES